MDNKPLFSMTSDELMAMMENIVGKLVDERLSAIGKPSVVAKGVTGLADALGVSRPTAYRMIRSHQIDDAITYITPKSFIVDVNEAKRLLTKERIG